ncbi:dihydrodipicolinate synthase family protein [Parapedobacter tibetensis]|uniref:dihydrodipicolinate synthase family protein n=1 Tax=Parapedobacter tibetensis TaxID=2972951 RepID=UPI00214DB980|nr:dihydrodipicolinate synthase family protein [Parapedobacter tibetensis]
MSKKRKGFIPVMLTPFKEDGAVDYNGLTRLTELYLNAGAAGLFANCLSSEMFEMNEEERLAVTKHVVDVVKGTVPVVATATFGGNIREQADFVKRMYDTGIEAAIVITNMLATEIEMNDVFEERVYRLLEHTDDIPLGFYECPDPFKRILPAGQLRNFVDTGRVIYHKDTCLDIDLVKAKLESTRHMPRFGLYDAYMVHAVESLKAGSAGLSCIQGNYFPELVVWLCNHYDDPTQQDQVSRVQQFFIDHMDVMHDVYPVVAKYFLQKRGLAISTFTRRFMGVFDQEVKTKMDILAGAYETLYQDINIQLAV